VAKVYENITMNGGYDPDDMLSLVSGRVLRDTKKALRGNLPRLKDGNRYGYLSLVMEDKRRSSYRCECDCGGAVYLTHREIHARDRLKAGCLSFNCPHGAEEVKVWHNFRYALWLQLGVLLKECPDEVCNEWGGSAYEGTPRISAEEGLECMVTDLVTRVDEAAHKWWLSKANPALPYSGFNTHLLKYPETNLFGGRSRYVMHGDTLYSVSSLATLYSMPLHQIERWKRSTISDIALMERILKETEGE
jgi:hypothetical protein